MNFTELQAFHFLRPEWLLGLLPALLLVSYYWARRSQLVNWQGAINKKLLEHLIEDSRQGNPRWPWLLLFFAWLLACLALSGPSWEKIPQPVHQKQDALVIVLDLSLSMYAEDIKPSRLVRARHKIIDILKQRKEGVTALIVYSGDAHIVSPLTDDNKTIINMIPALYPDMMPVFGSDPVAAFELARQLFRNAGVSEGRALLLTDDITENNISGITRALRNSHITLSIMGIGTDAGAPIPTAKGFLKDSSNDIIIPKLHRKRLERLAKRNRGRYTDVSLDDEDINFLLPPSDNTFSDNEVITEREFDQWRDNGLWLAIALLPMALLAFRRGWLLLLPLMLSLESPPAQALDWDSLWKNTDQRAAEALTRGEAKQAAELFTDDQWQGTAHYRAADYAQAAKKFKQQNSARSWYNQGNSLARAGQLEQAIEAYQQALQQQPAMEDAAYNKKLVEDLLEQQQDQPESDQDNQDNQDNQDKDNQEDQSDQQQNPDKDQDNNSEQPQNPDNSEQDEEQGEEPPEDQDQAESGDENPEEQNPEDEDGKGDSEQPPPGESEESPPPEDQQQAGEGSEGDEQEDQATEQWLRQIPDDPAGLLRRKFKYESQQQDKKFKEDQPQW